MKVETHIKNVTLVIVYLFSYPELQDLILQEISIFQDHVLVSFLA